MHYQTLFLYSEKQNNWKTATGQKFRRGQKVRLIPGRNGTELKERKPEILLLKGCIFQIFWTSFRLGFYVLKNLLNRVWTWLSFKKSGLDLDRKIWQSAHLWPRNVNRIRSYFKAEVGPDLGGLSRHRRDSAFFQTRNRTWNQKFVKKTHLEPESLFNFSSRPSGSLCGHFVVH